MSLLIQFEKAIIANDVKKVLELINDDADIMTSNLSFGGISILLAAREGSFEVLKCLLEKNPSLLHAVDIQNQSALLWAASRGHWEIVDYLAALGADVNLSTIVQDKPEERFPPLYWAIKKGYDKVVDVLIKRGASIDARWGEKKSQLLYLAVTLGHLTIVLMLLEKDEALINSTDNENLTPISVAASFGHEEIVKALVVLGADFKIRNNNDYLPIHMAIKYGHLKVFSYLQPLMSEEDDSLGRHGKHYIHVGAYHGQAEIIEYLLNQDRTNLEKLDKIHATPLFYTCFHDDVPTLTLLLQQGANSKATLYQPGESFHGNTTLDYAFYLESHKVANCLLLKMHEQEEPSAVFNRIQSGTQLLELIVERPDFIPLILNEERLVSLISDTNACRVKENAIEWYSTSKKRNSFFVSINKKTNQLSCFNPEQMLGKGGFAAVRLFRSQDGKTLAVKSPLGGKNDYEQRKLEIKREFEFNAIAYPSTTYATFKFGGNCDYRFVMPYIDAKTVYKYFPKVTSHLELAELIFLIAEELQRLHDLGILHKDIHDKNIMIADTEPRVRFIDFGNACSLTDERMHFIGVRTSYNWYPPEICVKQGETIPDLDPKPHANQDIYSLGYLLKRHLFKHPCWQELTVNFPMIAVFINKARDLTPQNRPSLTLFCDSLSQALNETKLSLKPSF